MKPVLDGCKKPRIVQNCILLIFSCVPFQSDVAQHQKTSLTLSRSLEARCYPTSELSGSNLFTAPQRLYRHRKPVNETAGLQHIRGNPKYPVLIEKSRS